MARLQRTIWQAATPKPKPKPKSKPKALSKPRSTPKPRAGTSTAAARKRSPAAAPAPRRSALGAGRWESYRRGPSAQGLRLVFSRYTPAPAASTAATPLPLLIMLHGCRQTADDFARGTRMNRLADARGFAVLYPQQAAARQTTRCWRWFEPVDGRGLAEADAIAALIRSEIATQGLDPSRVYVAGLSAGAGMAALVALRHPGLVAALALHSGPVAGEAHSAMGGLQTMRRGSLTSPADLIGPLADSHLLTLGMPTLVLQGLRDNAVSRRNAHQVAAQFLHVNALAGTLTPESRLVGAGTRREYERTDWRREGRTVLRLCEVTRLDHAWSGGDPEVAYHSAQGPDASALIWQFFRGHRRRAAHMTKPMTTPTR